MCYCWLRQRTLINFVQDLKEVQFVCYQEDYHEGALKVHHAHRHHHLEDQDVSGIAVQYKLVQSLRLCLIIGVMQNYEMTFLLVVQKFQD